MTTLRDELLAVGAELIENDRAPGWLDKAIDKARAELPKVTAEVNARLAPLRVSVSEEAAGRLLDKVATGKAPVLRLGSVTFAWLTANLESGDKAEARRLYLETQATFDERNAAIDAAGDQAFDEAKERNNAWEAFTSFVAGLGEVGLSILIAIAKRAVGIPT